MKKIILLTFGLALTSVSCSKKEHVTSTVAHNDVSISHLLMKEAPEEAVGIFELRKSAKPEDKVTFTGAVIGGNQVFVNGRAVMVVGDPTKITSCDRRPGDNCPTPWDVCCDDPEVIKNSILTVQVVNEAGSPLKTDLKGVGGLKELSTVSIIGTVTKNSNASNMIINASGIYIHPTK